jgi:hypothetical protein
MMNSYDTDVVGAVAFHCSVITDITAPYKFVIKQLYLPSICVAR